MFFDVTNHRRRSCFPNFSAIFFFFGKGTNVTFFPNFLVRHLLYTRDNSSSSRRLISRACETMEMEPLQLIRGMDVDIGMGLGDDLGGFEGFDAIFAEPSNTTDFFKCCALEDAQEQEDAATTSAFHGPPSPVTTFGQQQKGHDFALESWNTGGQEQVQAWLTTGLSTSEPCTRNPNALLHSSSMHSSGAKPRARKRHDEDEALEAEGSTFPLIKVRCVRVLERCAGDVRLSAVCIFFWSSLGNTAGAPRRCADYWELLSSSPALRGYRVQSMSMNMLSYMHIRVRYFFPERGSARITEASNAPCFRVCMCVCVCFAFLFVLHT